MFSVITHSPEETWELARKLAPILSSGDVINLSGDLGAGKTVFSKGLAVGLGIDEPVTSPTFTLIKEYMGRLPLYHFDVYRLSSPEEMEELGFDEYFYGDGVSVVEWGDKIEELLPDVRLDIRLLRLVDDEFRRIEVTPQGDVWQEKVDQWLVRE
ncbi:MAG: tRNA (adenosine(37)-N6)-threonylcarbamoyltransferase complex ATPase subunit type 1 TsaE [Candidatus Aquicultor secundus]|uniref:tRNA threonylcarbamoyladenosine biosynthesis protein TsaE n=1 Tax=Candidatus Aquicultor secundus TaxID=1973895 RepID=A0A2M7TAI4_9ACTN|nr:tRNA (adenosine(37)-N6)-threonylcarbamoyltransferase complex ATPase subunit type 1 TsaE [Candidatus Aquicultor secundus]NCO66517.1 tRNA (adenosine(37)-N6)-threonylcarbamoyltransferase complex ATPase subunit type 1 TsaE [Solirubrobacter sp.]OIO88043.1 MAG: tRNA (adenosine(37)-N6)-threonylcarbamoyltransferase complex ATPase subunit type 1 TsaE [Candidatus Aquicultor secundus]PIU26566.1 MAG: tRNA (adenosine(37)-N6)-threonylcarbamoyltransferase complex ATPase subunit type 1 TsaE [Candidatus Aquic